MGKSRWYIVPFIFLGSIFVSGGMLLKDAFEYSPTVGWFGRFVFFLLASYLATKANRNSKEST